MQAPEISGWTEVHIVARELQDRLLDAFKKAGWRADIEPPGIEGRSRPDMVVRRGPHPVSNWGRSRERVEADKARFAKALKALGVTGSVVTHTATRCTDLGWISSCLGTRELTAGAIDLAKLARHKNEFAARGLPHLLRY